MKKQRILAFLLAGTLVMSNLTAVSAKEATIFPKPATMENTLDAESETQEKKAEEAKKEKTESKKETTEGQTEETETQKEVITEEQTEKTESKEDEAEGRTEATEPQKEEVTEGQTEGEKPKEETTDSVEKVAEKATEEWVNVPDSGFASVLQTKHGFKTNEEGKFKKSDMECLEELDISRISDINLTGIEYAINLTKLGITSCGLTSEKANKHLSGLTKLHSLDLSDNSLKDVSFIKNFPELNYMNVSRNQITDFSAAFEAVEKNPDLSIYYTYNPQEGLEQIFAKCEFEDLVLLKGQVSLGIESEKILGYTFSQYSSNIPYTLTVNDEKIAQVEDGTQIIAKAPGSTEVIVKFGDTEKKFEVTVKDVEKPVDDNDKLSEDKFAQQLGAASALQNGQIWNWEDGQQKVSGDKDIKNYVSYYVYRENQKEDSSTTAYCEEYYGVDGNGTLWNFKKHYSEDKEYTSRKIAENVRFVTPFRELVFYDRPTNHDMFDMSYLTAVAYITQSNDCHVVYVDGTEIVDQFVCADVSSIDANGLLYLKDGTKAYVSMDNQYKFSVQKNQFTIEKLVKDNSYDTEVAYALDSEGNVWEGINGNWGSEPYITGVDDIHSLGYVIDGITYTYDYTPLEIEETIKETFRGPYGTYGSKFLTEDNSLYVVYSDSYVKVLDHAKQVAGDFALDQNNDLYYIQGKVPVLVLPSVVNITESYKGVYAQRQDGTLWYASWTVEGLVSKAADIKDFSDFVNKSLIDNQSGVTVEGLLEKGAELNVDVVEEETEKAELEAKVKDMIAENNEVNGIHIFDIKLLKEDKEIQPQIPVTVSLPIPEGFGTNLAVYHEKADGSLEYINSSVNEKTVVFTATSFSPYILVDLKAAEKPEEPVDPENQVNKSILEQAIADAKNIKKENYTNASWDALQKAIKAAEAVLADEQATQEDVNNQVKALDDAVKALKTETKDPVTPETDKNQGNTGDKEDSKDTDLQGSAVETDNKNNTNNNTPKTGDTTPLLGYVIVMFAAVGVAVIAFRRKRARK